MAIIEKFNTGTKTDPAIKDIDLDPRENIKNKKNIKVLLKKLLSLIVKT